eukprot:CAMPEP_0201507664 /NCGR_PEP_ID=MMETSP0161_2-20130828/1271_1 /ASSEMBLY_ACC=CAM_ASM_000251 /TAXON_ID=180227 /ORGANISM="Neoparamoeba aestuarina, Strain SoJaBio B1-5/56/2" /LENGTH=566 /DNA_ID=CAMNT_0047902095 /DNA_START=54 /DNA_END=1751 /DNA_ORIENTATION=-
MSSDMFGSPSAAFGFLLSPQEVRAAEEAEEVDESSYSASRDSQLMFSKPYHLITTDSLEGGDDEDEYGERYGNELGEDAYHTSYWILNFLGVLLFANLSLVLPSTLLFSLSLQDNCRTGYSKEKGVEGQFLLPLVDQPKDCLFWGFFYFGLSIGLLSLFQWVGGPLSGMLTKMVGGRKKPVLIVCMLLSTLGNTLYALANGPFMILLGRSLVGLSAAGINVCFSFIAITANKEERLMRIAVFRVFGMGGLGGAAAISFIFSYLEPPHNDELAFDAFTGPPFFMAALSLLASTLVLFGMRECQSYTQPAENEIYFFSRAAILNLFFAFVIGFLSGIMEWMIAPLTAYRWNWGVTAISGYFICASLLMFPAMVSVKLLKKKDILMRIGDRFFLFVSWSLMPLSFLLIWLSIQTRYFGDDSYSEDTPSGGLNSTAGYTFLSFGSVVIFTSFTWGSASHPSTMSSVLPPQARGKMMGLGSLMVLLGRFFGPLWGAYAYTVMDYQPEMMFGLLSDMTVVALALTLIFWKQLKPGSWIMTRESRTLTLQDAEMEAYSSAEDGGSFDGGGGFF